MAAVPRITAEDLMALPEGTERYELLDGEVYQVNPPTTAHQRVSRRFMYWLGTAEAAGCGEPYDAPTGLLLPDGSKAEPDVQFVRRGREHIIAADAIRGVPDLVFEVLSPSTRGKDTGAKYRVYERNGVPHYWWADPDAAMVTRHALGPDGRYRLVDTLGRGDMLDFPLCPGVTIPVADLFDRA